MTQFPRDGASIHYEAEGRGPPLLMVAGIASDGASWRPLVPLLAPHFSLLLIDNRGSGRSTAEGALTLDDMVADCVGLLDHLGLARVDVLGHSMGGLIGLNLAARHPERVRRLVTMTCGDRIGAKERILCQDMARLHGESMRPQSWFRLLFQWLFSEPFFADEKQVAAAAEASTAYVFRQSPADFARQVAAVDGLAPFDRAAVRCPTLAIAAGLDILVPPAAVLAGHAGIADLTAIVIEGAAHSVHWEAPGRVAAAVLEFLAP
jgi:aminoacrylate hydrolase